MSYLYDTNVISEVMRPSPDPKIRQWITAQETLHLSVITVEEIHFGLAYKNAVRQLAWLERFLQSQCQILPITSAIAYTCGQWRGKFRKTGMTRTQADMLIAATAYHHRLTLATRNIRDFADCDVALFNPFIEQ